MIDNVYCGLNSLWYLNIIWMFNHLICCLLLHLELKERFRDQQFHHTNNNTYLPTEPAVVPVHSEKSLGSIFLFDFFSSKVLTVCRNVPIADQNYWFLSNSTPIIALFHLGTFSSKNSFYLFWTDVICISVALLFRASWGVPFIFHYCPFFASRM